MKIESFFKDKKILKIVDSKKYTYFLEVDENLKRKDIIKNFLKYAEKAFYFGYDREVLKVTSNFKKSEVEEIEKDFYAVIQL